MPAGRTVSLQGTCLVFQCLLLVHLVHAQAQHDAQNAVGPKGAAVVSIVSPDSLVGRYLGVFGEFSGANGLGAVAKAWHVSDGSRGCRPFEVNESLHPHIAVIDRGNCSFESKAWNAQLAGAVGVVIVLDTDDVMVMGRANLTNLVGPNIFAVAVQRTLGAMIEEWESQSDHPTDLEIKVEKFEAVEMSLSEQLLDPSLGAQVLVATGLIVAGAYYSTSDLRSGSPFGAPPKDAVFEIQWFHAMTYCMLGSFMLVVFYFLMKYLIYFIIVAFSIGGSVAILQLGSGVVSYFAPRTRHVLFSVPDLDITVAYSDILAGFPTVGTLIGFLWFRNTSYGFIFQDALGAGFLCSFQRSLRLPNLKVASVLLWSMFFFDIFWVFLSPWFFRKSVMVEVATGAGTGEAVPMLIRMPSSTSSHAGERILGFGDIALPGLLLSYLLRYDMVFGKKRMEGYFTVGVSAYVAGLILTMCVSTITQAGQPALLYLVPATLGSVKLLACWRKELRSLMEGIPDTTMESLPSADAAAVADMEQNCHRRGQTKDGAAVPDVLGAGHAFEE